MKTFRKFRSSISDLTEELEPAHDLTVLEFALMSEDDLDEDVSAAELRVLKNVKSLDTKKTYPFVIYAVDPQNDMDANGYAADPEEEFGVKTIPYEKTVANLRILPDGNGHFYSATVFVLRAYRRQGLATKLYSMAQKLTGNKMIASGEQSPDGKNFTRSFFGEDEGGAPTNNVGGGAIAGAGVGPNGEPGVPPKKLKIVNGPAVDPRMFAAKIFTREEMETSFAGAKVFKVDPDTYAQCRLGKHRYHRWSKYVGDSEVGQAIREFGKADSKCPIVVMHSTTGEMMYLRHADLHNWKEKK